MLSDLEIWQSEQASASSAAADLRPVLFGGQGLLAENLALKYDACQFH
jgi:hypothetical protein